MKTLDHYMNDPSVVHMQMPLREVKAIRLMIHDEQKNMTPNQVREHYDQVMQRAQSKSNIKFATSAKQI